MTWRLSGKLWGPDSVCAHAGFTPVWGRGSRQKPRVRGFAKLQLRGAGGSTGKSARVLSWPGDLPESPTNRFQPTQSSPTGTSLRGRPHVVQGRAVSPPCGSGSRLNSEPGSRHPDQDFPQQKRPNPGRSYPRGSCVFSGALLFEGFLNGVSLRYGPRETDCLLLSPLLL